MAELTVHVNAPGRGEVPRALVERAVQTVLREEEVRVAEISVTFLDDEGIREMNARYLERDRVTDVIAFALHEQGEAPLGDVYVGAEQGARQATDAGVGLEEELVRLAVHGVLHVLGYDHPEDAGAREASDHFRRQEEIVRRVTGGDR